LLLRISPKMFAADVDEFVAVLIPKLFWGAIGYYYDDFAGSPMLKLSPYCSS
jgi:hypothetical protein